MCSIIPENIAPVHQVTWFRSFPLGENSEQLPHQFYNIYCKPDKKANQAKKKTHEVSSKKNFIKKQLKSCGMKISPGPLWRKVRLKKGVYIPQKTPLKGKLVDAPNIYIFISQCYCAIVYCVQLLYLIIYDYINNIQSWYKMILYIIMKYNCYIW